MTRCRSPTYITIKQIKNERNQNMKNKRTLLKVITSTSVALLLSNLVMNSVVRAESNTSVSSYQTTIQKYIVNKNKLVKEIKINKGDKVQFLIKSKVLNNEPITSIKFSDDFENVFDIDKNVEVFIPKDETTVHDSLNFKEDFNNLTKQGVLKVNEDNESFEWIANNPNEFSGKTLYLVVKGTTKKDADYKKYISDKLTSISDVAKEQINSQELTSNSVDVIIKPDSNKNLVFIQNALAHQHISLDLLNDKKNKKATNINQIQQTSSKSKDIQNSNNKVSNSNNKITLNITSDEYEKEKKNSKQVQDSNKLVDKEQKNTQNTKDLKKENTKDSSKNNLDFKDKENIKKDNNIKKATDKPTKEKLLPNTGMTDNITYVMVGLIISLGSSILLLKVASKHYKNRKKC
ncbi:MAG: LPXTG cell wall anchor domain-containing protein [Staphylococcus epidermidis]|nr:LPXTG cell wall anchor domain-containing protein [Staphylococcus epidermidis]